MNPRFEFITVPPSRPGQKLCAAVADGLRMPRKQLPCRFFYDEAGSELFERICDLPEYYPTRTERAILARHANDIIHAACEAGTDAPLTLIEFGSGSSCKTRLLIEAALDQQATTTYVPIDISGDFLRASCLNLLQDYPSLAVTGLAAEYSDALRVLPDHDGPRLFLFLGSNIGNFEQNEASAFLAGLRAGMMPNDRLLIGVDLVKDRGVLEAAYNDAAGVTGEFNKNLLRRINRELIADFDLDGFAHHAPFVQEHARIEMHLVSQREQTVNISELELSFDFAAGEIVHTENSHKYTMESFAHLCAPAGLEIQARWTDENDWFAELLLRPKTPGTKKE
jgi:L-histidine N-alpha-methyltransferase